MLVYTRAQLHTASLYTSLTVLVNIGLRFQKASEA